MEFPDLRGAGRGGTRQRRATALDNTWGAGVAFDPFAMPSAGGATRGRGHLGPGADEVPVGRRRPADGLGDHARRRAAHPPEDDPHAARAGASAPTTSKRCCARCRRSSCATRPGSRRAPAGRVVGPAQEIAAGAASGARRLAGPCALAPRCAATRPACSPWSSTRAIAPARVDAFVDALRLFRIGYSWAGPGQPGRAVRLAAMRGSPAAGALSIGLEVRTTSAIGRAGGRATT